MLAPSSWVWTRITMPTVQELTVINNSGAWRPRKLIEFSSARHEWMTLCNMVQSPRQRVALEPCRQVQGC